MIDRALALTLAALSTLLCLHMGLLAYAGATHESPIVARAPRTLIVTHAKAPCASELCSLLRFARETGATVTAD